MIGFVALLSLTSVVTAGMVRMINDKIDTDSRPDVYGRVKNAGFLAKRSFVPKSNYFPDRDHPQVDTKKKLVLLQLTKPLRSEERAELAADLGGLTFDRYVPDHTWIEPLTAAQAQKAVEHKWVSWVGPYTSKHKLAGQLIHLMQRKDTAAEMEPHELLIVLHKAERDEAQQEADRQSVLSRLEDKTLDLPAFTTRVVDHYRFRVDTEQTTVAQLQALVRVLTQDDAVLHVERHLKHSTFNKYASWITQSREENKRPIWDAGIRGQGMIVGAADSGLDYSHCMFNDINQPKFSPGNEVNRNHRKILGYYAFDGADFDDDIGGHGTHVVGSITGSVQYTGPDAERIRKEIGEYNGQAPDAKLVFHDIGKTGGGLTVSSAIMDQAILQPAYNLGARVHSNSWGCSGSPSQCNTYDEGARAVDTFVKQNRDMVVLFAAGNDGANGMANTQTVGSPATAKSALVIGAQQSTYESFQKSVNFYDWSERREQAEAQLGVRNLDCCSPPPNSNQLAVKRFCCPETLTEDIKSDPQRHQLGNVAEFSSRGPTFDGRIKPDLMAPGQNIVSAHADGNTRTEQCGLGSPEGGNNAARLSMQGTSMATPTAAGNAVLVQQYLTEGWYPSGRKNPSDAINPSGALVKALLVASSYNLDGEIDKGNNGTWSQIERIFPGTNIFQGFGAIQLNNVLKFINPTGSVYFDDVWPNAKRPDAGLENNETVSYCIEVNGPKPLRAVLVWDDEPASPQAEIALINDLDLRMGSSQADSFAGNFADARDSRNTVEHVIIERTSADRYFVRVDGTGVNMGPQPYALVITGSIASVTKGAPGDETCSDPFTGMFAEATDEDYFPYGEVIGPAGTAATIMAVLIALVVKYLKQRQG